MIIVLLPQEYFKIFYKCFEKHGVDVASYLMLSDAPAKVSHHIPGMMSIEISADGHNTASQQHLDGIAMHERIPTEELPRNEGLQEFPSRIQATTREEALEVLQTLGPQAWPKDESRGKWHANTAVFKAMWTENHTKQERGYLLEQRTQQNALKTQTPPSQHTQADPQHP